MGTTLTAAYVGEEEVAIAHVGDSRAYRLRDGKLERLTEDHSLVEELLRQGRLTEEEAEGHPQRSIITRALGPEPDVEVDRFTARARAGDVYLLCSDGLTSMVPESRVLEILAGAASLAVAGRALIDAANSAGGRDNVTVVLFSLEEVSGATAAASGTEQQATMVGAGAPRAEELRAALDRGPAAPAAAVAPEAPRPRTARVPRMPAPKIRARRRRIPRPGLGSLVALTVLALVVAGGWVASRTVYFVGTNTDGLVTIYRGVPYDLPAGVHLYSPNFISGVDAAQLTPSQQRRLLDHTWRTHNDATDLVRELELGHLRLR
jgi:protein phosphatase